VAQNAVKDGAHITFGRIRKSMSRLKISAISYLNTAPLMWDFEHAAAGAGQVAGLAADLAANYEISYTIPSACAEALRAGTADIGIIPAAAYTTVPDLVIIPDVAIAAKRAVRSILLVSKKPVDSVSPDSLSLDSLSTAQWATQVRTVALDTSSMTSVALTKILFAKWLGGARDYKPMAPHLNEMLAACDAALLIGDPALQVDRTRYFTLDLAEEWKARTGKSFVFAFWAIRKPALAGRDAAAIAQTFKKSRDHGVTPKNLEVIAQEWAPRLGLSLEAIRVYLTQKRHNLFAMSVCPTSRLTRVLARPPVLQGFSLSPFGRTGELCENSAETYSAAGPYPSSRGSHKGMATVIEARRKQ
jgi:chorismate dehydratase